MENRAVYFLKARAISLVSPGVLIVPRDAVLMKTARNMLSRGSDSFRCLSALAMCVLKPHEQKAQKSLWNIYYLLNVM